MIETAEQQATTPMQSAKLLVSNITREIQAGGPFRGHPSTVVMLGEDPRNTPMMHDQDILEVVSGAFPGVCKRVVIRGVGDAMGQPIYPLCCLLLANGYDVQVETTGMHWPHLMDQLTDFSGYSNFTLICAPQTRNVHPMVAKYCRHWLYTMDADQISPFTGMTLADEGENWPTFNGNHPPEGLLYVAPALNCDADRNEVCLNKIKALCFERGYILG